MLRGFWTRSKCSRHKKVFSVEVQQVKRDEHALSATEKQITEHRPACTINAGNLTIEHCAVHAKMFSDPCGKIGKAAEGVSLSGNQFSLAFLDVSERTKSIDLSRSKFPTNRLSDN
jgi:hypothetical protein